MKVEKSFNKYMYIDVYSVFREIYSTIFLLIYGCGVALSLECTLSQVSVWSRTEAVVQGVL